MLGLLKKVQVMLAPSTFTEICSSSLASVVLKNIIVTIHRVYRIG